MKITFLGAGSTVFVRNVIGDCLVTDALRDAEYALYDIDPQRLDDSLQMLENINRNANAGRARFTTHVGLGQLDDALRDADFAINAVQVGGYEPSTVIDFEIPKKYGLRQTIADTLGVGGVFRTLRTLPVMDDFAESAARVAPNVLLLNYSNPMAMLSGYLQRYTSMKTVGLCHSVQVCAPTLMRGVGMEYDESVRWKIAGINHMGWLLEITRDGVDLYPEIKRRSLERLEQVRQMERIPKMGEVTPEMIAAASEEEIGYGILAMDQVRHEMMHRFGYYVTESSEHNAEYHPWFIKSRYPELIERYNIPLDEYPRRCVEQIAGWRQMRDSLTGDSDLSHDRTHEYASYIMEAIVTNRPYTIGGNVLNTGLIENLPREACVEVPCLVDANGVTPTYVGKLPEILAALNRTNINVQLLTIEAYRTKKREDLYRAVMLDPHTAAELSIDDIVAMCDEMLEAHGDMMPTFS
ncbi:MAG: alpha-glucosidase/alpha-galactosidase [Bacillota bacterium]|nr:alpha-glucosidase/alpha-galactosidase [Bacillota bacterium]